MAPVCYLCGSEKHKSSDCPHYMAEHGEEGEMADYYYWRPSLNPTQIQVFHQKESNIADQNTAVEINSDFNHYYCYCYSYYHYHHYCEH